MSAHYCLPHLLPGECIQCIGRGPAHVLYETWGGTVRAPVELIGRTPRRVRVRFLDASLGHRYQRGDVALVPIRAVRDQDGEPLCEAVQP